MSWKSLSEKETGVTNSSSKEVRKRGVGRYFRSVGNSRYRSIVSLISGLRQGRVDILQVDR